MFSLKSPVCLQEIFVYFYEFGVYKEKKRKTKILLKNTTNCKNKKTKKPKKKTSF